MPNKERKNADAAEFARRLNVISEFDDVCNAHQVRSKLLPVCFLLGWLRNFIAVMFRLLSRMWHFVLLAGRKWRATIFQIDFSEELCSLQTDSVLGNCVGWWCPIISVTQETCLRLVFSNGKVERGYTLSTTNYNLLKIIENLHHILYILSVHSSNTQGPRLH